MRKFVIIGGGIAGLAAAYRLQEEIGKGASLECVALEAADRFGGKIATERFDGFIVERGPDSFISQKPAAIELCKKLGLGHRLVGTNQDGPSAPSAEESSPRGGAILLILSKFLMRLHDFTKPAIMPA